jgi:GntR family transcriptional regulator, transcriptional repressor for pyruvate dehydrogenase complex
LKHGDQLPSERELTDVFKVSRTTVREAIRTLESMKLVQSRQGNGTYILASSEESLVLPLAAALFTEKDDILDIFYIRKIIEPYIAQKAAQNATPQEVEELEKILLKQAECIERGENIIETDSDFHNLMAKAAKNRVMGRLLIALIDLMRETREEYLMENEKRAKRSLQGHQRVLDSVRGGNSDAAQKSMLRHLEDIEGIILNMKRGGGK